MATQRKRELDLNLIFLDMCVKHFFTGIKIKENFFFDEKSRGRS